MFVHRLLGCGLLALCAAAGAQPSGEAAVAALPRVLLDTRMPLVQGRSWTVGPRDNLQTALNRAQPGDEIVLQAGATYVGGFTLPLKTGARMPGSGPVIVVRSSAMANLPEGKRVGPRDSSSLARLMTPQNGVEALGTVAGTDGWRLIGLDVTPTPAVTQLGRLARFGDGSQAQRTDAMVPQNVVLDRSYVHAAATADIPPCIDLHSAATALLDSYVAACHSHADAHAIA